jgi:diguanylate cyclase (GGDEF)-like protein
MATNPPAELAAEAVSRVSTGLQTACMVMVAVLLWMLQRVIGQRFLAYWSAAWFALVLGLFALNASFHLEAWARPLLSVYMTAGYVFGMFLYVGCRRYGGGRPLNWRDAWLLVPALAIGLVLPGQVPHINALFPPHALMFGGYALLALAATLRARAAEAQTLIGLRLLQIGLAGMVALFWHYSAVMTWMAVRRDPAAGPDYLQYSSLYDAFVELTVAFAQVVLATDSVRRELADANRQLASATEQLALAARTDALTGLLNRRAFEATLADPTAAPAPGSLAVLDLNDLKPLNDNRGHAVGDAALRAVAKALQARTRLGDPVFRMGGDEFLVLLPGVTAEELTRRLADMGPSLLNTRLPGLSQPVELSVAWGVAEYHNRADLAAAVERADAAMYAHKRARASVRPASAKRG